MNDDISVSKYFAYGCIFIDNNRSDYYNGEQLIVEMTLTRLVSNNA